MTTKKPTKAKLIQSISRKLQRKNLKELLALIENLKPKAPIEYEVIYGTFNSKETGKIHTMISRPKRIYPSIPNLDLRALLK